MHKSQDALSLELKDATKKVKVGGLYCHYKNPTDQYRVLNLAIAEQDQEICVIYQSEYGKKLVFVRSLSSWLEKVEVSGSLVKRFRALE